MNFQHNFIAPWSQSFRHWRDLVFSPDSSRRQRLLFWGVNGIGRVNAFL